MGGDEGDQLAVGFHAALGQELLQIKAAVDFHLVDGAILVAVVPGTDLLQAGQGSQLIVPDGPDPAGQDQDSSGQQGRQDLQSAPPGRGGVGGFHRCYSSRDMGIYRRNRRSRRPESFRS